MLSLQQRQRDRNWFGSSGYSKYIYDVWRNCYYVLIQTGGLGLMTIAILIVWVLGKKSDYAIVY